MAVIPRLGVRGVTVHFGEVPALDHVDLDVPAGEVTAVLGPSGSGKSTLLRVVAGLQPLANGIVELDGADQRAVPPHRRGVGLMFQDHALFPHRDVAGNIAFGLRMQNRPRPEVATRVDELLELVDLAGFGRRRVSTLSGGEQQRVALARALAPRPRLLLLDEPLGALDRGLREHLVVELRSLFDRLSLTVMAVTHDQSEAFALADRLVLMDRGRLLQTGTPADVWGRPASGRVAALLGFPNLLHVRVQGGVAHTPWGTLRLDHREGPVTLLVRPAGVVLDPRGSIEGVVTSSTFQGGATDVVLALEAGPPLTTQVPVAEAPAVGSRVRVVIREEAVEVLGG